MFAGGPVCQNLWPAPIALKSTRHHNSSRQANKPESGLRWPRPANPGPCHMPAGTALPHIELDRGDSRAQCGSVGLWGYGGVWRPKEGMQLCPVAGAGRPGSRTAHHAECWPTFAGVQTNGPKSKKKVAVPLRTHDAGTREMMRQPWQRGSLRHLAAAVDYCFFTNLFLLHKKTAA